MKAHYQAPSIDALQAAASMAGLSRADLQHDKEPTARFEGESTVHRDFQAPPSTALNQLHCRAKADEVDMTPAVAFEGESSMRAHFQAPSSDTLRAAAGSVHQRQTEWRAFEETIPFEGHSTTHEDPFLLTCPACFQIHVCSNMFFLVM